MSTNNTPEAMKLAIITALKNHEKEMEGYSYFGSNRGVSKDDYEDIANEAQDLFVANDAVASPLPNNWREVLRNARLGVSAGSRSISDMETEQAIAFPLLDHIENELDVIAAHNQTKERDNG